MRYFFIELKRHLASKFTIIIFLSMTIFLLLHIPFHMWKAQKYIENTRIKIYTIADSAESYKEMTQTKEDRTFYHEEFEDYYFLYQVYNSKQYEQNVSIKTNTEYDILKRELLRAEQGKDLLSPKTVKEIKQEMKWYEALEAKKYIPYATPYDNQTFNFLYLIMNDTISVIILLLLALSIIPMIVCSDFEVHTYKYVYTSKASRATIMLTKFGISVILPLAMLLLSVGITSLITGIVFGLGISDYPYLLSNGMLITANSYLFESIKIFAAVLFFFASILFALSYICKKQVDAITYFSLFIAITYVFLTYRITLSFFRYIPIFYLNVENILTNALGISIHEAIIYCISFGMIVVLMVVLYYRKKDLLVE